MGLGNLFGAKKLSKPVDYGLLEVDMHSHLIPGIDDGARTMDDAIALLGQMKALGFKKVITTPHIQNEFYTNTPDIIHNGLGEVRKALKSANLDIQLEAAAEYLIDDGFEEKMEKGDLLTFGDRYVLLELSYYNPHPNFKGIVFNLQVDGYKVILAHPERYSYWFKDWQRYTDLKDRGVFFQLNTVSLAGHYPDPVRKMALKLIEEGLIEFTGSDLHNPHYMDSLEKARNEKALNRLVRSGKLLNPTL
jgi:tyrosine-protein phosphatase YwqE